MAWFNPLKRTQATRVGADRLHLVGTEAAVAILEKPKARVVGPVPTPTCEVCGKPLEERVIATGAPGADTGLWNEAPFAVDGWVCERDGQLAYPRPIAPATITSFGREGARAAQERRLRDSDWWLTRMTTDWPGFVAGYVDLAQTLAARLREEKDLSASARRLIERRHREALESAVASYAQNPDGIEPDLAACAHIMLAEHLISMRSLEPAARALEACGRLEGVAEKWRSRCAGLATYLNEEGWIFADASTVVQPYLRFMGSAYAPVDTPQARQRVTRATEALEGYFNDHPKHWLSGWTAAMAAATLGDPNRSLGIWRKVWGSHPGEAVIVREFGLELLRQNLIAEALRVARDSTTQIPRDATIWCNRAVVELLAGDLDEAARCVATSRQLDPEDSVAAVLEGRLGMYRDGRPLPTTLAQLEGRRV